MEYIDILDEAGNLTGKTESREEVHKKGYWHRAINVFIINKDNQLLIQKRAANKYFGGNERNRRRIRCKDKGRKYEVDRYSAKII